MPFCSGTEKQKTTENLDFTGFFSRFPIYAYCKKCRRPESNRFKQSQILIERGFEDFITVAVFKKCSNVCRIQTKKLLLSA